VRDAVKTIAMYECFECYLNLLFLGNLEDMVFGLVTLLTKLIPTIRNRTSVNLKTVRQNSLIHLSEKKILILQMLILKYQTVTCWLKGRHQLRGSGCKKRRVPRTG
jgi:hypothetical protein